MTDRATTFLAAARDLALDATAASVLHRLRDDGVPALLLKGPVTARWLYHRDELRRYGDVDVLVPRTHLTRAESVLRALGFVQQRVARFDAPESRNCVWQRAGDQATVDLQTGFWGASAPLQRQWDVFSRRPEELKLAGVNVDIPGSAARAFQVALHAAKHGTAAPKPMEDLRRAIARLSRDEWRSAACLAEELGAANAFSWGLRLLPEGAEVAEALGLATVADAELILRRHDQASDSVNLQVFFSHRKGIYQKLIYLADRLAPRRRL